MNNKIDWKYIRTQLANSLSNEKIWSLACAISSEPNVHAENCQKLEQAIADIDSGSCQLLTRLASELVTRYYYLLQ